jgi:hypothetical protein
VRCNPPAQVARVVVDVFLAMIEAQRAAEKVEPAA